MNPLAYDIIRGEQDDVYGYVLAAQVSGADETAYRVVAGKDSNPVIHYEADE